jgi:hypothetical protein
MGSFSLQHWTRIGSMSQLAEVGRVAPSTLRSIDGLVSALGISATEDGCAPSVAMHERVVAPVGAHGLLALPFRLMKSLHDFITPHWDHEHLGRAALPRRPGDRKWSAQQRSPTRLMKSASKVI